MKCCNCLNELNPLYNKGELYGGGKCITCNMVYEIIGNKITAVHVIEYYHNKNKISVYNDVLYHINTKTLYVAIYKSIRYIKTLNVNIINLNKETILKEAFNSIKYEILT